MYKKFENVHAVIKMQKTLSYNSETGISNRWTGIWNETMEWKMECNSEHTQLQLTRVTGAAQSRLNYLVYLYGCYLTAGAL